MIGDLIRKLNSGNLSPAETDMLARRLDELEARMDILRGWIQPGGTDPTVNSLSTTDLTVAGNLALGGTVGVSGKQVLGPRVVDARCDDAINSGDATTDGVIDSLRDAMITHGLIAAA